MASFDYIIGQTVTAVFRQDPQQDYDFMSPLGLYLIVSDHDGIYLGVAGDETSVNVELMDSAHVNEHCGVRYLESVLSRPRDEDELTALVGEQITSIELAEYTSDELTGANFIIKQGRYAGIRILTTSNELVFFNQFGGQLWINMNYEIPNKGRWTWTEKEPQHKPIQHGASPARK